MEEQQLDQLEGTIEDIIFENSDSGYVVFEMFARALVGFWMVPVFGYWAGCIASPVAWFAACFFLIPAYQVVMHRLEGSRHGPAAARQEEMQLKKA